MSLTYVSRKDLRQVCVVAKNEMHKLVSGKRFLAYVVIVVLMYSLITFLPYFLGSDIGSTAAAASVRYASSAGILVILSATLFASMTIAAEYESRTALLLFTKPIKKTTIFLGKFIACFILEAVMILIYYGVSTLAIQILLGSTCTEFWSSMGMALIYLFAVTGIGMLVSTLLRKTGTAAVVVFMLTILMLPIISTVLTFSGIYAEFMLDQSAQSILYCIPYTWNPPVALPDLFVDAVYMFLWGTASMFVAWFAFQKKEF